VGSPNSVPAQATEVISDLQAAPAPAAALVVDLHIVTALGNHANDVALLPVPLVTVAIQSWSAVR
jgi:hypothetical protein